MLEVLMEDCWLTYNLLMVLWWWMSWWWWRTSMSFHIMSLWITFATRTGKWSVVVALASPKAVLNSREANKTWYLRFPDGRDLCGGSGCATVESVSTVVSHLRGVGFCDLGSLEVRVKPWAPLRSRKGPPEGYLWLNQGTLDLTFGCTSQQLLFFYLPWCIFKSASAFSFSLG